ncbi:MAG: hypothetical protein ACRDYV_18645, partial [Acidimicrobiia bacterium]
MSNQDLGSVLLAVLLLILGASLFGQLFSRFRQPKVVGEILAGVLLGPTLLGKVAPGFAADVFGADNHAVGGPVRGHRHRRRHRQRRRRPAHLH